MRSKPVVRAAGHALLLGFVLATTGGCVRFGAKPPNRLLSVASEARLEPGKPQSSAAQDALFVEQPAAPKVIATQRIAVRVDTTSYAYVKNAQWVDTPAHQFQALLAETIGARTGRLVLDPGQYPAKPGKVLQGELLEFGVDAGSNSARVTYDASLVAADGQMIRRQRFSATRSVATIDADSVAPAINAAANEVAAAVSDWIKAP